MSFLAAAVASPAAAAAPDHHAPRPALLSAPPCPACLQTRRLVKFPDSMKAKAAYFQRNPPRHSIPREQTRLKLPDLDLPAEARLSGGGRSWRALHGLRLAALLGLPCRAV